MLELGRAQKTIFIARYLRDRDLQREIEEGLNLIESWNRVNGVIFFGKSGEFATNRRDQQQLGMLALHGVLVRTPSPAANRADRAATQPVDAVAGAVGDRCEPPGRLPLVALSRWP